MKDWKVRWEAARTTPAEAMARIPRGKHVFIGSGAAEPVGLVTAMVQEAHRFADNNIVHLLTLGPAPYVAPEHEGHFRHNAFFIGPNVREAVHRGRADYTPVFLSQIPRLIRSRRMPVDVALVQVSPPDQFGFVNLGVSVDIVKGAVESADLVIAEVNPQVPRVFGSGFVHADRIDAWIERDAPLISPKPVELDEVALEIGRHVAALVEDGATMQMGIGAIPDATLRALDHHKDLGVWTEMFSDGLIPLLENGNVTGRNCPTYPGKVASSFTFGSQELYRYIDGNPVFTFHPSDVMNDPVRIASQHKMVAVNSAIEVDLTGQVCADSIGGRFYSGIGGQVDFIRGASMCPGGKPVIALRSTAKGGEISRIVPHLEQGAGVVTSRGDVRYVVTEYGVADLQGRSIRERVNALVHIAHPDFRAELLDAAKERRFVFPDQIASQVTYPDEYVRALRTRGGKEVMIRPLRVTDERMMSDLFYNLSEDTRYKRWMQVVTRMPHHDLQYYLDVDYTERMALGVEACEAGQEPELVGVARFEKDPASREADVAFVVRDDWQGQGVGSMLLERIAACARDRGIEALYAEVLADNLGMMRVFHKSGLPVESRLDGPVYVVRMPL